MTRTAAPTSAFPRRMLVLSVSKYLYCNTLVGSPSAAGDAATQTARRLAFDWRIPSETANNQLYVVSDTAGKDGRAMLKPVIQGAYEQFFATSRPQDRVVVYFGGHAVLKDDKAYLVPTEGDPDEPATLIPVWRDSYAKLKECPAQQKVVDVGRVPGERGGGYGPAGQRGR